MGTLSSSSAARRSLSLPPLTRQNSNSPMSWASGCHDEPFDNPNAHVDVSHPLRRISCTPTSIFVRLASGYRPGSQAGIANQGRTGCQRTWNRRRVWLVVGVHLSELSLQFSDPQPQHLVLPGQVGRLGLVESALVSRAVPPCNVDGRGRAPVASRAMAG